jgi:hypothetical protein
METSMPDEQTPTPHLEKLFREVAEDEFWAIRGKTINGYADLEQSLCQLFAFLGGIERDIVGIIFFKITSHQRNSILDRLFKKKFGDQYSLFRNSLTAQLKPIDIARNEIVHWNTEVQIGSATNFEVVLRPPNFWDMNENTPQKTKSDLIDFIEKCSFYSRLCNMFYMTMDTSLPMPEADKKRWLEIFAQRITYPPPPTHPLFAEAGNTPS